MKYIFNPFTQSIEAIPTIDWEKVWLAFKSYDESRKNGAYFNLNDCVPEEIEKIQELVEKSIRGEL